jgi:hypothetical protein
MRGIGTSLVGAYWGLGPLAAWHFGGILASAAENEPGGLIEHYQRLDYSMERSGRFWIAGITRSSVSKATSRRSGLPTGRSRDVGHV